MTNLDKLKEAIEAAEDAHKKLIAALKPFKYVGGNIDKSIVVSLATAESIVRNVRIAGEEWKGE